MAEDRDVVVLGVRVRNLSMDDALRHIQRQIDDPSDSAHIVFIVNAHTINLSADDARFRETLNAADTVFADGTGMRWAARMRGLELSDNLVGTDLVPKLLSAPATRPRRVFLLGADAETINKASEYCRRRFPNTVVADQHHGYIDDTQSRAMIDTINQSKSDVLLVGMGNPIQEEWLNRYRHLLRIPVAIGVGGLFDHWGGNLTRAPAWIRRLGMEWLQILAQQPSKKWRRYIIGNPKFLFRVLRASRREHRDSRLATSSP